MSPSSKWLNQVNVARHDNCKFHKLKSPNMALNLAPFGRWTLRDKAAQRRLALRWASRGSYGS